MKKKIKYFLPKKPYFKYLGLLLIALAVFIAYALVPNDLTLYWTLNKMKMPQTSAPPPEEKAESTLQDTLLVAMQDSVLQILTDSSVVEVLQNNNSMLVEDTPLPYRCDAFENSGQVDTSKQRFLLIGDSMGEFLRIRLNDYCKKNGHSCHTVIWYSSSTEWYGSCDTLRHFIKKYRPTYILISLGANELFIKNIIEKRTPYVKRILAQVGNLPYVWIGPPNWKPDTGINDMIVANVGYGHYFESKKLQYKRGKDGAHPVKSSAYNWMDHIADYLYHDAAHRVVMERPDEYYEKVPSTAVISPKAPKKK